MITIKAFDKGLVDKSGFKYEVGKTYTSQNDKLFYAAANCDITNTMEIYYNIMETEYAVVDINVIERNEKWVAGNKIRILRKISDLFDILSYDKTGKWTFSYATHIQDSNPDLIPILQYKVVEKDKTGKWITYFATYIENSDIEYLQEKVIEVDQTGEFITKFAIEVPGANINLLQRKLIDKDKTGHWILEFSIRVPKANLDFLRDCIIEKFGKNSAVYELFLKYHSEKDGG